jgi:type 1 glutamine amidotransferase
MSDEALQARRKSSQGLLCVYRRLKGNQVTTPLPCKALALVLLVLGLFASCQREKSKEANSADSTPATAEQSVLVVRGGHAYDTPAFEEMCRRLDGLRCDLVLTAHFETMSAAEIDERYDAVMFLNQNKKYPTEARNRKRYMDLAKLGVGMVFLHFTLSSEPEWDAYHELVGGKWFLKKHEPNEALHSTYFTDMTLTVKVLDVDHPTTEGLVDFEMTDAFYGNIHISPSVHPLWGTDKPDVSGVIAWSHRYENSKVVYVMPGFTEKAYTNESYQKFLVNSIGFVAGD